MFFGLIGEGQVVKPVTTPTTLVLTSHGLATNDIVENTTRSGYSSVTKVTNDLLNNVTAIIDQKSGDVINKYKYLGQRYVETGTNIATDTIIITNHGLSTGDYIRNPYQGWVWISKITVIDANTFITQRDLAILSVGNGILLYKFLGQQTAL